jgi:1,2-diacylglycerol 3-alpha-glucosyltransferase
MSEKNSEERNILLLWDRIGDYHAARFLALEHLHGKGRLWIADIGGADSLYKWKNPLYSHPGYCSLSDKPVEEDDLNQRLKNFKKLVREKQIRLVGIAGYGRPEYRQMMHWCRLKGIAVVLFAESWYPGKLDFLKGLYLRLLCRGFLVSGIRARQHFVHRLGLPESRVKLPYSVVDNSHFAASSPDYAAKKILCLARFSPEKNLENLTRAFEQSGISEKGWTLELTGGGPVKKALQQMGTAGVAFREWVSYEELPSLYASASAFILPSSFEPWGLVVNEAMAAGLPVAVSEECGCAPDLVPDAAFRFPAADQVRMAAVLRKLAEMSPEERLQSGKMNRQKAGEFSPEHWAKSFLQLAE